MFPQQKKTFYTQKLQLKTKLPQITYLINNIKIRR